MIPSYLLPRRLGRRQHDGDLIGHVHQSGRAAKHVGTTVTHNQNSCCLLERNDCQHVSHLSIDEISLFRSHSLLSVQEVFQQEAGGLIAARKVLLALQQIVRFRLGREHCLETAEHFLIRGLEFSYREFDFGHSSLNRRLELFE